MNRYFRRSIFGLAVFFSLAMWPALSQGQTRDRKQNAGLIVSFYSICCGIDSEAREKLDKYVTEYERTAHRKLSKEAVNWGREGEVDYCFKLTELSSKKRKSFITRVKLLLKDSKLVRISENAPCNAGR